MAITKTETKLSLKQRAYDEISRWIVQGVLKQGQPLIETELAERLNISRTPIREALRELEKEGLVEIYPRRGTFVTKLTLKEIQELFEIREALEGMAARLCAKRITEEELQKLSEKFERAQKEKDERTKEILYEQAGDSLHETILTTCGNPGIKKIIENYKTRLNRERKLAAKIPGRIESAYRDHVSIYRALKDRDPDGAEGVMRNHIAITLRSLLETFNG